MEKEIASSVPSSPQRFHRSSSCLIHGENCPRFQLFEENAFGIKAANEEARIKQLLRYKILQSQTEQVYDDMTLLALSICDAPISFLSIIYETEILLKSCYTKEGKRKNIIIITETTLWY